MTSGSLHPFILSILSILVKALLLPFRYLLNAYSTMFSDSLSASSSCIMQGEP